MPEQEEYEIIPITPIKRLEKRLDKIEESGTVPQLQSLINQIIELIRSNQKIVNDVIRANTGLRNEISKMPPKLDELIASMKNFISLIEAAGREEVSAPSADSLKPLTEQLKRMVEQNQKLLEGNEAMIDELTNIGKKLKSGTPVSRIVTSYPGMRRFRKEVK
jgi:methyl-accepting chemotaxis protein